MNALVEGEEKVFFEGQVATGGYYGFSIIQNLANFGLQFAGQELE